MSDGLVQSGADLSLSRRKRLAVLLASLAWSCGARSELLVDDDPARAVDSGGAPDAGVVAPACATAPAGKTLWTTALPTGTFYGPVAADEDGSTYYIGVTPVRYPETYTIVAIDACGKTLWQTTSRPAHFLNGALVDVVVSGDHVLFQWGTVDAFDRATGALLWNADLDAYASESLADDDSAELGPLVVASDGTAFLAMNYGVRSVIATVDTAGRVSTLVTVTGSTGDISGFILDAAGHLDVLYNSVDGAIVDSYARDGSVVFASQFTCNTGFLGPLASGASFLVMQSGPCAMDFAGNNVLSPPEADDGAEYVTIDASDDLYFNLQSSTASGQPRWTTPPPDDGYVLTPLLLATGGELFAATSGDVTSAPGVIQIEAYDRSSGETLATYSTGMAYPRADDIPTIQLLLTPAGELVFLKDQDAVAIAAGQAPDPSAPWPMSNGGVDRRNAAPGQ